MILHNQNERKKTGKTWAFHVDPFQVSTPTSTLLLSTIGATFEAIGGSQKPNPRQFP